MMLKRPRCSRASSGKILSPGTGLLGQFRTSCRGKLLQFTRGYPKLKAMTQPLALVLYERLLPGTQLVNRLQDLNYRVQTLSDPALLVDCAKQAKPMIV